MRAESLRFLQDLLEAPSPSGHEGPVAKVFREYLAQYTDELTIDVSGNVIAAINPAAKFRIMLTGHLDQVGFVITSINDDGLLRFEAIGDNDPAVSAGQRVWVYGKERLPGGIGRVPIHLQEKADESGEKVTLDEMWIDIGARDKKEAESMVEVGDPATYAAEWMRIGATRVLGAGFDDKAGAFIIAEVLRTLKTDGGLQKDVGLFAAGTVQEEIGYRGAAVAAYGVKPNIGIAVDVAHATDVPEVGDRCGELKVGAGPSISRGAYLSPVVTKPLRAVADKQKIPYQLEAVANISETDATSMQNVGMGLAAGLVGVPLRSMHTPCEVIDLDDVENCVKLLAAFCSSVCSDMQLEPWQD